MNKTNIGKRIASFALAAVMLSGSAALSANAAAVKIGDTNVSVSLDIPVNGSGSTLELNKTYSLPGIISGLTGNAYRVSLSNNNVMKYKDGKLTTVGTGKVTVYITLRNGKKLSKTFNVQKPQIDIAFTNSKINMLKGQSKIIVPALKNSKAKLSWKSSNSKVVSVDQSGKLKAVKAGTAVITATLSSGKSASFTVTVGNPVAVTKVNMQTKAVKLPVGKSYQLNASVSPSNATDKTLTYTSSNPKVVTVSNGKLTGKSAGTAAITVKSSNGKTASCTVTVIKSKKA